MIEATVQEREFAEGPIAKRYWAYATFGGRVCEARYIMSRDMADAFAGSPTDPVKLARLALREALELRIGQPVVLASEHTQSQREW